MDKFILKSKTVWGIIIMALPVLLPVLGVPIPDGIVGLADTTFQAAIAFGGAALALFGRWKARDQITLKP